MRDDLSEQAMPLKRDDLIDIVRSAASHLDTDIRERLIAAVTDPSVTRIARGIDYSRSGVPCPVALAGLFDESESVDEGPLVHFIYCYDDATGALAGRVKVIEVID